MKPKSIGVATLATTLVTFGSLTSEADAAVIFTANGNDLVATINTPISWTLDGAGLEALSHGIAFLDASTGLTSTGNTFGSGSTATLSIGSQTSTTTNFGRAGGTNAGGVTATSAWMLYIFSPNTEPQIGDQVTLSAGTIVWTGFAGQLANMNTPFDGEVLLVEGNNLTAAGSSVSIPEPTSAFLLGFTLHDKN